VDRWGQEVRHLRLKYLPRDGSALVNVPVALVGKESAPGVKGGSRLHVLNDTVPLVCQGWAVPPRFELDVGKMRVSWGQDGSCGLGTLGSAAARRSTARDGKGSNCEALGSKLMPCCVPLILDDSALPFVILIDRHVQPNVRAYRRVTT
jgi:hypothetical protein